jgi:hypothetical protein
VACKKGEIYQFYLSTTLIKDKSRSSDSDTLKDNQDKTEHTQLPDRHQTSSFIPPTPHRPVLSEPLIRANPDMVYINNMLSSYHSHFIVQAFEYGPGRESESSANINQTPGKHPKVDILNTEHGESLKSRIMTVTY